MNQNALFGIGKAVIIVRKVSSPSGSATFDFKETTVDLDKATIGALSGNATVSVALIGDAELPAKVKTTVGDRPVYNISMGDGSGAVHNLGGKATVTLRYELKAGESAENLIVWCVADDGEHTTIPCTYTEGGLVAFETTHFSYYAIMYEAPAPDPVPVTPAPEDNTMIVIVVVAVVALAAVSIGAFLFVRSRKNGSA